MYSGYPVYKLQYNCIYNLIFLFKEEDGVVENIALSRNNHTNQRQHHSIMYAPKCLVLVSRLDYIETFRVININ